MVTRPCTHLHQVVGGVVASQLLEAVDEALAGVAVDLAGLQHVVALLDQLHHNNNTSIAS